MTNAAYGTILLVEDDLSLASWVQEFLQQKGYQVLLEQRGDTVLPLLRRQHVDLILLDLMLPGLNGLDVCRQIRRDYTVPVLMLTAQGEEVDEVIGLGVGATDYLVKPVRPRILLARIQAALRQSADATPSQQLVFGGLTICASSRRVLLGETDILLTSAEFALLWYLASRAGQVCSRDQVFQALKGREHDGLDRRFDVMVSVLRKKLGDDAKEPKRIKTVWGQGYLFVTEHWTL
ncbi:response regulator transcription factor [Rheinheimera sp. F8]|uniref:response regulator transcription factor n=1 Tax=Rheinheimera sp. F8 TaxID=1763998 RepID=UPI00074483D1|nr:response regulator transcription factor [Rheinheimera sp. F8]ALZ77234.1 two-component system response regulator [Rheinheimera sp. F8]